MRSSGLRRLGQTSNRVLCPSPKGRTETEYRFGSPTNASPFWGRTTGQGRQSDSENSDRWCLKLRVALGNQLGKGLPCSLVGSKKREPLASEGWMNKAELIDVLTQKLG